MNFLLSGLLSFLLVYKYPALFLIVFASAVFAPFPTDTMLVAVGAFASQGYFSALVSYAAALSANILGDILSYVLWKRYGKTIIREKYAQKYRFFEKIELYVKNYTGPTVFVSRFIGIMGPIVNFLAGWGRVRLRTFVFGSVFGNAINDGWPIVLGYIIGSQWENFSGLVEIFGAIVVLLAVVGTLIKIYFEKR